jgi:hypothetical protein
MILGAELGHDLGAELGQKVLRMPEVMPKLCPPRFAQTFNKGVFQGFAALLQKCFTKVH